MIYVEGTVSVIQEIKRTEAAKMMMPPVTERQLQKYISLAALYLEEFSDFIDPNTGTLNCSVKLTHCHIQPLRKIRKEIFEKGFLNTERDLSSNPSKYRGVE